MFIYTKRNDLTAGIATAAVFGGFAAVLLSIVWGGFWAGLTLSVLWGWFVAPLFAAPALGIWQAYGLVLVFRAVRGTAAEKSKDGFGEAMAKAFMLPPLAAALLLAVGWCAKAWA